jgi:hypothetical protein
MPDDETPETNKSIREAHDYGQITLDVRDHGQTMVSDEVIQRVLEFARKRIQEEVVPAVEEIVANQGGQTGQDQSHTGRQLLLQLPQGELTAFVGCEITPGVSEDTKNQVRKVLKDELAKPLEDFFQSKPLSLVQDEDDTRKSFLKAVRSVLTDFSGRGG